MEQQVAFHDLQRMDHVGCWSRCVCGLLGVWQFDRHKECCLSLSNTREFVLSFGLVWKVVCLVV